MIGSLDKQHASDPSKCVLQGKAKEYLYSDWGSMLPYWEFLVRITEFQCLKQEEHKGGEFLVNISYPLISIYHQSW
jgi:hypothetical protein